MPGSFASKKSAHEAAKMFASEYSPALYEALKKDKVRMEAYQKAIDAAAPGCRVLDVGTGPEALLAVMAARAKAVKVTAVEVSEETAALARAAVEREGLSDIIEVIAGYSTQVHLPEVDLVIHELIGDIGTEEGMAMVLADLQQRPTVVNSSRPGWVLPRRVLTWITPVKMHFAPSSGNGVDKSPEVRLPGKLPTAALLGEKQILEDIDADKPFELTQQRTLSWTVDTPSTLTGFVCAPLIEFSPDNVVDASEGQTHWRQVIAMLPEAALVDPGNKIEVQTKAEIGKFPAEYRLDVYLRPAEGAVERSIGTVNIRFD